MRLIKLFLLIVIIGCAEKAEIIPKPEFLPFKPQPVGGIEGLVYETDAKTPISGVMVLAYDRYGYAVSYSQTDMHGRYRISNLPFGEYILQIRSGELYGTAQKYAGEYYKNAYNWREAGLVSVTTQQPTFGINFILEKGGVLRGKLVDATKKEPIANTPFFLLAYKTKHSYIPYVAYTDSLGEYVITGLEPGSYKIQIEPEGWVGGFYGASATESWYKWDSGWTVESAFDTITLADFETFQGGAISGKVEAESPIIGVMIEVTGSNKGKSLKKNVDSTGYYIISGLPPDQYLVKLSTQKGSAYACQYYPTIITVATGDTVHGINFQLVLGGVISGVVTDEAGLPIDGFDIEVYPTQKLSLLPSHLPLVSGAEVHSSGGRYEIRSLPEGEYILKIGSFNPRTFASYITNFYSDTIKVKTGYNTSGINFTLKNGGWVQGFLFLNNELLSSEDIEFKILAFNLETNEVSVSKNTFCGGYRVTGLAPGEYKLCAFSPNSEFAAIWFGGGRTYVDPKTSIVKIEEGVPTNVDFSVTTGNCKIYGKVIDVSTNSCVSCEVIAYDHTGHIVHIGKSNEEGYVLQGLAPGKYFIRTYVGVPMSYKDKWYKDVEATHDLLLYPYVVKIPVKACEVEVKEGESLLGIDFHLGPKYGF